MNCIITFNTSPWAASNNYSLGDFIYGTPKAWASSTSYAVGDMVRSTAGDRYQCTTAGTSGGTEPTWDTTIGNTTNDNTAVWTRVTNSSGDRYECTTAGQSGGTEPTWDTTIGNTTNDNAAVWTRRTNVITWAGETWVVPAQSGVEIEVCPTSYKKNRTQNKPNPTTYDLTATHYWRNSLLLLKRGYYNSYLATPGTFITCIQNAAVHYLRVATGKTDSIKWFGNCQGNMGTKGSGFSNVGKITTASPAAALYTNYLLTANWFGTFNAFGLTYSWNKGSDWP